MILLLVAGAVGFYRAANRGRPAMGGLVALDRCIQYFGTVYPPTKVIRQFRITNTSRQVLVVQEVTHSPGASSRLSRRRLAPGETATLRLIGDTRGNKGKVRFSAFVNFQGVKRTLPLHILGTVAETFPTRIDVGNILRGSAQAVTYDVRPEGGKKITAARILHDEKFLRVHMSQRGVGLRIHATFNPQIPYGDFVQPVTLETNDSLTPKKKTVITGYVLERLVCQPDHISLGVFRLRDQARSVVQLTSPYSEPFTIRRVTSNISGLHLQPDAGHKAVVHTFHITGTNSLPQGPIEGTVTVETSLPEVTFRLPLYGLCLPKDSPEVRSS